MSFHFFGSRKLSDKGILGVTRHLPPYITDFSLIVSNCGCVTDQGVNVLANGLPDELGRFSIALDGCEGVTDKGSKSLLGSLPSTLEFLGLDLGPCVTDACLDALAEVLLSKALPRLRHLVLNFAQDTVGITEAGLRTLGAALPEHLLELQADFSTTTAKSRFSFPAELTAWATKS